MHSHYLTNTIITFATILHIQLFLLVSVVSGQELCSQHLDPIKATVNETYNKITKANNTCTFYFSLDLHHLTIQEILDKKVELYVSLDNRQNKETWKEPLMVSVRQQLSNTNIKLPYTFEEEATQDSFWYFSTKRTLCLPKPKHEYGFTKFNHQVIVTVDTSNSVDGIAFTLYLMMTDGLLMGVGQERTIEVSPMSTTYFRYEYEPNVDMVEILFSSSVKGESICTLVAADDPFCPIYDQEETIGKVSEYKRMTSAAVIRARKADYKKGLVILMIPLSTDGTCSKSSVFHTSLKTLEENFKNPHRKKEISLTIRSVDDFSIAWMFAIQILFIFVPCVVGTLIVFCFCDRRLKKSYYDTIQAATDEAELSMVRTNNISDDSVMTYASIIEEADESGMRKKYNRYCTVTCFISAFYVIPVYQFLYYHWKSMGETGNYDHCYYNELCRIKIHELSDFNHFISNLLYVIFGLTFIAFVYWRSCTLFDKPEYRKIDRGLRVPFGAYMAMGLSLIMEGVLSSAYHFCPSGSTFQFDVAFMYVIAVILLSTIHQLRFHASPSGTKGFILLTILTIISALFYVVENFWSETAALTAKLLFCISHILFMAIYCLGLYFHGTIKDSRGKWYMGFYRGIFHVLMPQRLRIKMNMEEMRVVLNPAEPAIRTMKRVTLILLFLLNLIASIFLAIFEDFAHYLLNLLIGNVLLSVIMYISWKIFYWHKRNQNSRNKSKISIFLFQTILYFVLALLFGMCGFRKFNIELTEWRKTAAESRVMNKPCSEFWSNFYDHHDVWHFFSAVALFFSFMGLLTIDDGIIMLDRKNIHLF